MQIHKQLFILLIAIVGLLSGCGWNQSPPNNAIATLTPGPAPTQPLTTLAGEEVTLQTWQGQGVIVNFWATWCYPCREEMPYLASIHEQNPDITVVGVNYLENADAARGFVEELDLPFPIIVDERGFLVSELQVKVLPTTFFINKEGHIVSQYIGVLDELLIAEHMSLITSSE